MNLEQKTATSPPDACDTYISHLHCLHPLILLPSLSLNPLQVFTNHAPLIDLVHILIALVTFNLTTVLNLKVSQMNIQNWTMKLLMRPQPHVKNCRQLCKSEEQKSLP